MESASEQATVVVGDTPYTFSVETQQDGWKLTAFSDEKAFQASRSAGMHKKAIYKVIRDAITQSAPSRVKIGVGFAAGNTIDGGNSRQEPQSGDNMILRVTIVDEYDEDTVFQVVLKSVPLESSRSVAGSAALSVVEARKLLKEMETMKRAYAYMKTVFEQAANLRPVVAPVVSGWGTDGPRVVGKWRAGAYVGGVPVFSVPVDEEFTADKNYVTMAPSSWGGLCPGCQYDCKPSHLPYVQQNKTCPNCSGSLAHVAGGLSSALNVHKDGFYDIRCILGCKDTSNMNMSVLVNSKVIQQIPLYGCGNNYNASYTYSDVVLLKKGDKVSFSCTTQYFTFTSSEATSLTVLYVGPAEKRS